MNKKMKVIAFILLMAVCVVTVAVEGGWVIKEPWLLLLFLAAGGADTYMVLSLKNAPRFLKPFFTFAYISAAAKYISFKNLWMDTTMLVIFFAAGAASLIFLFMMICTLIGKKAGFRKRSPWKGFAIGVGVLILLDLVIAILDLTLSQGMFAGLLGAVLIYYGLPLLAGILVLEYIIYKIYRHLKDSYVESVPDRTDAPPKIVLAPRDEPDNK